MALKPCIECGTISQQPRCPDHRRAGTTARGYGTEHQQERAAWLPLVEAGDVVCRRAAAGLCVEAAPHLLLPGQPWHLGHPDAACPAPKAPEHVRCNSGAPRRRP